MNTNARSTTTRTELTWRGRKIELRMTEIDALDVHVGLLVDHVSVGDFVARSYTGPGIALGDGQVAVWVGGRALVHDLQTARSIVWSLAHEQPIDAIYAYDGQWVVVGEIDIEMRSSDFARRISGYSHHEIILSSAVRGNVLTVEALDGATVRLLLPSLEPVVEYGSAYTSARAEDISIEAARQKC